MLYVLPTGTAMSRKNFGLILALALIAPVTDYGQALQPSEALDRYLASGLDDRPECSNLVFSVQIDAAVPSLKKHASMTGFKRIVRPGQVIYRGVRFTGDNFVRNQVIARFLTHDRDPSEQGDVAITPANYVINFDKTADYNGLVAYAFLLKPRRKRAGMFRGELWLDANTAAPLRIWGDLVRSPSIFIRSFRFVQDYQTISGCDTPLRILLTSRARIAGPVEMTVWMRPAAEGPDARPGSALSGSKYGGGTGQ